MNKLPEIHKERFEAWLFSQPDDREWNYQSINNCMICSFLCETTPITRPGVMNDSYWSNEDSMESDRRFAPWLQSYIDRRAEWTPPMTADYVQIFTAAMAKAAFRKLFPEPQEPPVAVPKLARTVAILLALLLPFTASAQEVPGLIEQAPKEELEAAASTPVCIVVAGAVVVGGLYACYLIARLCKKVFPAPPAPEIGTNGIPGLIAAGDFAPDTDAACYLDQPLYSGSCFSECGDEGGPLEAAAVDNRQWTVVQVDIEIGESEFGPTARVVATKPRATTATTDLAGFQKGLARWGLHFDPSTPGQSWAHNGKPVPANGSPIQLNIRPTGTVPVISYGGVVYPAVIERSTDLVSWEFLTRAELEPGLRLRIVDTTPQSQMFYRLRVGK